MPYSPLGRGFLSGQIRKIEDMAKDDVRHTHPRFQGENFQKNLDLVTRIEEIAREKRCAPAQLALAWLLAQGTDVVPIPGTKSRVKLEENAGALSVEVSAGDKERIEAAFPKGVAAGSRYSERALAATNG